MRPAETLLPDTQALKNSTVQFEKHAGRWLVRYRDPRGNVVREHFSDALRAHEFFLDQLDKLKKEHRR